MWRVILGAWVAIAAITAASCNRKSDFITETSPFLSVYVPTPSGGHKATAERANEFARRHGMKLHYVPGHFQPTEFTISVVRRDLNIVTGNVLLGERTLVTAYTRLAPTNEQRALVDEFLCSVMMHGCENSRPAPSRM